MEPIGGGRSGKVNCCQRWQATSKLSGAGGAANGGKRRSVRARAVGEGQGVFIEESGGDMNTWLGGWQGEVYCHLGKSNVMGTTDGYRIVHVTK